MADRLDLELPCQAEALDGGWRRIDEFLERHRRSEHVRFVTAMVFEEVLRNILEHSGASPDSTVVVKVLLAGEGVELAISDAGAPFDPCRAPLPPQGESLASAPIGGRGLRLMRRMAQSLRYRRVGGRNRLEVQIADRPA